MSVAGVAEVDSDNRVVRTAVEAAKQVRYAKRSRNRTDERCCGRGSSQ